jgi:peptidoglycan/LPS O-acetylase OafA/YrhL
MRKSIDPGLSIYFDLVRIIAAIVVVFHHVWPLIFPQFPLPWPGHEAVVVFFVLSGYVIAYTASDESIKFATFAGHRAARILSVAIPALLLAAVVAPFAEGPGIEYAGPVHIEQGDFLFATLINAVFLGQSFGLNISPPFNGPFWSICFEVWYYAIFAAWTYSSKKWRAALTVLTLAFAGLKIVMLLPVWLLGTWLFHNMPKLTQRQASVLFLITTLTAFIFYWSGASHVIRGHVFIFAPGFMAILHGSNQFIGDLILGILVTANFAAVASLGPQLRFLLWAENKIRYASSFTLSTYLYHMPLTVLIWNGLGVHNAITFLCLLTGLIVIFGMLTERQVRFFRRAVRKTIARIA